VTVTDKKALIARHVDVSDRAAPEEARLRDSGIRVWALVEHLKKVDRDPAKLAEEFGIPSDAVAAALAYYDRHKARIDARIVLNTRAA
jgi:uncharacterized protein (DUF433 family)